MTTDWRALCAELLSEFDYYSDWSDAEEVKERARASLPELEPKGPTDEELMKLAAEALGYECIPVDGHETEGSTLEAYGSELLAFAHAVLARWGRPTPKPADDEVAELVAWFRREAELNTYSAPTEARKHRQAADLLERLSPPQPS